MACIATLAASSAPVVRADTWPDRPIRIIVPTNPGSPADVAVRSMSDVLMAALRQPIVIENKGGAQGVIGAEYIAKAAPDGYTFGAIDLQTATVPALRAHTPYNLEKSFTPVSRLTLQSPVLLVLQQLPVNSFKSLVKYMLANPGKLTFSSSGSGSPSHLGMELLASSVGASILHVPYNGSAQAATALASGQVDMTLVSSSVALPLINTGRVKALAASGEKRLRALPSVPTFAEEGFGKMDLDGWVGIVAPARTAPDIVARMNRELNLALKMPVVQQRLQVVGSSPAGDSTAAFASFLVSESVRWQQVIRQAGIRFE